MAIDADVSGDPDAGFFAGPAQEALTRATAVKAKSLLHPIDCLAARQAAGFHADYVRQAGSAHLRVSVQIASSARRRVSMVTKA
jgi:hypothetical protein